MDDLHASKPSVYELPVGPENGQLLTEWRAKLGLLAYDLVRRLGVKRVLDLDCSQGVLVQALRACGVEAYGLCASGRSLTQVESVARPYCWVGAPADSLSGQYDLVTCLDAAALGIAGQARAAVQNLCTHAAALLFSCAATTDRASTDGVRPWVDWLKLFGEFGFAPDFAANFSNLPGAILLYRSNSRPGDELLHYFARSRLLSMQLTEEGKASFIERDTYELLAAVAAKDRWIRGQGLRMKELESQVERQAKQLAMQDRELERLKLKLLERDAALETVLNSKGWRFLNRYRGIRDRLFSRFLLASARGRKLSTAIEAEEYRHWIEAVEMPDCDPGRIEARLAEFRHHPLISILLPAVRAPGKALERAIVSVRQQLYPVWELCICGGDGSTSPAGPALEAYVLQDTRIKVGTAAAPATLSAALRSALQVARGEFVGLLEPDGELSPDALFRVVELLQHSPDADFIYSDEDRLDAIGQRCDPFFKPDWSPEYMLALGYTGHFSVYRKNVVEAAGGFRAGTEGAEVYDLTLRVSECAEKIVHVPRVLYHGRRVPAELPPGPPDRHSCSEAGRHALQEHMKRRGIEALVIADEPGRYRVRPRIQGNPLVSIVIATRDRVPLLRRCLSSIRAKTEYSNYEIVIADNGSEEPATAQFFASLPYRIVPVPGPFNFSRINNLAGRQTEGQYLLFLNNDTEVLSPEWLTAMLELCQLPQIGAVGAKLLYPNRTIQHAGVLLGLGGVAGHCYRWYPAKHRGYFDSISRIRNYSAVTAACCLVPRGTFEQVGGFDEDLPTAFNDVDLCLRIRQAGYRVLYTPYAVLYHHESRSRGYELDPRDMAAMKLRWGEVLAADASYNPNLSLDRDGYHLRAEIAPPRVGLGR
jgi:GT2 family glycosyltransferase